MNAFFPTRALRPWSFVTRAALVGMACTLGLLWESPAARSSDIATVSGRGLPFPHRKLANVAFVAFDTETTGVNPKRDRIVEIAAVKYQDGKIIAEQSWLVNPERRIPAWSQRVHGITDAMVKSAPTFAEIYPEFEAFIEGSVLIAHNAPFDISFVSEELGRADLGAPPNMVVDSLGLFRTWFPELKSYSLKMVASHVDIPRDTFHRALADSMYVALIFNEGAKKLDQQAKLSDVYADCGGPLRFR